MPESRMVATVSIVSFFWLGLYKSNMTETLCRWASWRSCSREGMVWSRAKAFSSLESWETVLNGSVYTRGFLDTELPKNAWYVQTSIPWQTIRLRSESGTRPRSGGHCCLNFSQGICPERLLFSVESLSCCHASGRELCPYCVTILGLWHA